MPKFCPECGYRLLNENAKFCSECGYSFRELSVEKPEVKSESEKYSPNIYQLGEKLEEVVEKIFQAQGFETERRRRLKGKSGTINEIDILAKKGRRVIAVECKNLSTPVGISQVRDFTTKLEELKISKGYFASNTEFSSGAKQFAEHRNITLWTKDNLMEKFWSISIGRSVTQQKISIKNALPVNISFDEVIELHLKNKEKVELVESDLFFHPYFAVEYSFKADYKDPTKKIHKFREEGIVFIDALDGNILNQRGIKDKILKKFFSKEDGKIEPELLKELNYYANNTSYEITVTSYHVKLMKPQIQDRFAKKLATDFIINNNVKRISYRPKSTDSILDTKFVKFVPKKKNVLLKRTNFFYLPKWSISFLSGNVDYTREVFAFSGNKIEDTITYCSKHFGRELLSYIIQSKKSIAVCEICGQAFCEEHVKPCPSCGKWLCFEDGVLCASCGTLYCTEHVNQTCSICGKMICDACSSVCPICGNMYGKQHQITCDNCGAVICSECSSSKGLIRKKYYCVRCAQ